MRAMYLNAFAIFELMLNSVALLGNFDSCFALAAVQLRSNMLDSNVADWAPLWGE